MENMTKTVLIIDDNPDFREAVIDILLDQEFDIYEAECPKAAFDILFNEVPDIILCDLNMPFTTEHDQKEFLSGNKVGIETIKELGWAFPDTPIICISAASPWELVEAEKELGHVKILRKPVSPKDLLTEIEQSFMPPFAKSVCGEEFIEH